jgi:drug/metabolite transporter (DMT)-like permease
MPHSALLFFVGCHGILAFAQQTVPSGVAAILLATIPFWILLLDVLFPQGKRPSSYALMALVPGFSGVAIVAWQNIGQQGVSVRPIAWLLAAALSWSVATVLSRRTSSGASSMLVSGMQLAIGGAVLLAMSYLTGEMRDFSPRDVSATSLTAAVYLIISGSVIGFAAYHWLLHNVSTSLVSTYTFINPIVAVLRGTMILGEPFSISLLLGACLVIASVVVVWRAEHAEACSHDPRQARLFDWRTSRV